MDQYRNTPFTPVHVRKNLSGMHHAHQRRGIPRLHLAGHGPKRRRLPPPAQNTIGGRPLKTRRHLQARRARHTRIHPPRPRNRRRLQPVQRKLPQHGRQNGPRRHPAKHPDTLRRIRKANHRTTRIRTHQPRQRTWQRNTVRMGALAHGQRSARWSAGRAAQGQGVAGGIDRAMQRVGELNTRIDAVKERIQGIDGAVCSSSARIFNACARTSTRRAGNVMP